MLGTIFDAIKLIRDAWPRRWSDVESRVAVDELGMTLACRGAGRGRLRVSLFDASGRMIANLEGENRHDGDVLEGCNLEGLPHTLLEECFRLARSYREFDRTGDLDHSRHDSYFRTRAVWRWRRWQEAEAEAMEDDESRSAA